MTDHELIQNLRGDVARLERINRGMMAERNEADQILGRALGYPQHPEGSGNFITAPNTFLSLCDEVASRFTTAKSTKENE